MAPDRAVMATPLLTQGQGPWLGRCRPRGAARARAGRVWASSSHTLRFPGGWQVRGRGSSFS